MNFSHAIISKALITKPKEKNAKEVSDLIVALQKVSSALKNKNIRENVFDPSTTHEEKKITLMKICESLNLSEMHVQAVIALKIIGALKSLSKIIAALKKERIKRFRITEIQITSPLKLETSQTQKILESLKSVLKVTDIEITENIDEEILGGLIIQINDEQLDLSIKEKINKISKFTH